MAQEQPANSEMQHWGQAFDDELRLSDYLSVLRRRWIWIAAVLAAVLAAAVALSFVQDDS